MRTTYCWACGSWGVEVEMCEDCGAPPWVQTDGPDGVYILRAACGLVKIGYSRVGIERRVSSLQASNRGEAIQVLTTMPGASMTVERWLHAVLIEVRDIKLARDHELPAPTEWFWPTPALNRLAADYEFLHEDGSLWEEDANFSADSMPEPRRSRRDPE